MLEMLAAGVVLIVLLWALDLVYESLWLPILSYLVMGAVVGVFLRIELHWLVILLPGFVIGAFFAQYSIWRRLLLPGALSRFVPTKYSVGRSRLVGATGVIVESDNGVFVKIHDEMWKCRGNVVPGDAVEVTGFCGDHLEVCVANNSRG